jgi:hypothetical protein
MVVAFGGRKSEMNHLVRESPVMIKSFGLGVASDQQHYRPAILRRGSTEAHTTAIHRPDIDEHMLHREMAEVFGDRCCSLVDVSLESCVSGGQFLFGKFDFELCVDGPKFQRALGKGKARERKCDKQQ